MEGAGVQDGGLIEISDDPARVEEALRSGHRLLRLVLDTLPVGVAVFDRAGDIILANMTTAQIWAGMIVEAEGRYAKSVGYSHESGHRLETKDWPSQRALTKGEYTVNELLDIEAFDGTRKTIQCSAAPLRDADDVILGAVTVLEDVTERVRTAEEVARRARQQEAIAQLSLFALGGDDAQAIFEEAVALAARILGVEYCMLIEAEVDQGAMRFRAGAGRWDVALVGRELKVGPDFVDWFSSLANEPVVIDDLPNETRLVPPELLAAHDIESGFSVAIPGKARPFGVLGAYSLRAKTFNDDERSFVRSVAGVLATCIEQRRVASALREKRAQLEALSRKLIEAQEAERRAISRELHDDIGQVLTAIKLNLQRRGHDHGENVALVDAAIDRMRDLARDLRPTMLDDLGLAAALRWYVGREAQRAGLLHRIDVERLDVRLPAALETSCYRIVQEALTNVIRHAKARHVAVECRRADDQVQLIVRDDGRGFDTGAARVRGEAGCLGLEGMKERVALAGGRLEIDSAPGCGTTIHAAFPLGENG